MDRFDSRDDVPACDEAWVPCRQNGQVEMSQQGGIASGLRWHSKATWPAGRTDTAAGIEADVEAAVDRENRGESAN